MFTSATSAGSRAPTQASVPLFVFASGPLVGTVDDPCVPIGCSVVGGAGIRKELRGMLLYMLYVTTRGNFIYTIVIDERQQVEINGAVASTWSGVQRVTDRSQVSTVKIFVCYFFNISLISTCVFRLLRLYI